MVESLQFKNETLKQNWATNAFKEELKKLANDKESNSEMKELQINIIEDFLEKNKDKDRNYWISKEWDNEWRSGKIVTAIQIALKDFWFNPGSIDWKLWPKTNWALNKFKEISQINEEWIGRKIIQKIIDNIQAEPDKKLKWSWDTPRLWNNMLDMDIVGVEDMDIVGVEDINSAEARKMELVEKIDEIRDNPIRTENTVKTIIINGKQYWFFNNGRAGVLDKTAWKYINMQNTVDIIDKLTSRIENKKSNLIKQLSLVDLWDWMYEKLNKKWLYMLTNEWNLIYSWPDYWNQLFVWPRENNRKNIDEIDIPSELKIKTTIKVLNLIAEDDNKYTRDGYSGYFAFGHDNKLYYSGIDWWNKVFSWFIDQNWKIVTDEENRWDDTSKIPEEIEHISV